ncbi:MAG: hypothetical protein HOV81_32960 [Kofleriaceae bacterium]|nr:hypothetical protein [Kofleriaceae bacterium]
MSGDSISIPAVRIGPVATEAASGAKTVAAIWFFVIAMVMVAAAGNASNGTADQHAPMQMVVGMLFWVLIFASIAVRYLRAARRATAAVARASADPSSQWFLSGKMIVGVDASGAPNPGVTFKLSRKLRTMLLAVPAATVVEKR